MIEQRFTITDMGGGEPSVCLAKHPREAVEAYASGRELDRAVLRVEAGDDLLYYSVVRETYASYMPRHIDTEEAARELAASWGSSRNEYHPDYTPADFDDEEAALWLSPGEADTFRQRVQELEHAARAVIEADAGMGGSLGEAMSVLTDLLEQESEEE